MAWTPCAAKCRCGWKVGLELKDWYAPWAELNCGNGGGGGGSGDARDSLGGL